jgi:tetratricopeptide (TPR) repeat protein
MIPCKHCNTFNSLDSTFCKRCGTGLPEAEMDAAKAKLEALVQDGMHALNEGRINEAMAVAETAVVADPSMVSAFALKSAVHERKGEVVEALECAERIVELNPDSELDKIKRNQLRAALGAHALAVNPPNRVVASVAALSVIVILVSGAVLLTRFIDRPQAQARYASNLPKPSAGQLQASLVNQETPTQPQATNPQTQGQTASPQPTPPQGKASTATLPGADGDDSDDNAAPTARPVRSSENTAPLNPGGLGLNPLNPPAPADPPPAPVTTSSTPPNGSQSSAAGSRSNGTSDPPPVAEVNKSNPATLNKPVDPGLIEITVHRGNSGPNRGGSASQPADSSKMLYRMGVDSFQIGNFDQAAQHLEKARSSGADPITVNERLGQSYAHLGRKQDAISAYQRAIEACTNALNAGRGDSSKMRAVRDACETAVRQIQGS